jgi:hypothetical protein
MDRDVLAASRMMLGSMHARRALLRRDGNKLSELSLCETVVIADLGYQGAIGHTREKPWNGRLIFGGKENNTRITDNTFRCRTMCHAPKTGEVLAVGCRGRLDELPDVSRAVIAFEVLSTRVNHYEITLTEWVLVLRVGLWFSRTG